MKVPSFKYIFKRDSPEKLMPALLMHKLSIFFYTSCERQDEIGSDFGLDIEIGKDEGAGEPEMISVSFCHYKFCQ
jgi:hypothetical protein